MVSGDRFARFTGAAPDRFRTQALIPGICFKLYVTAFILTNVICKNERFH